MDSEFDSNITEGCVSLTYPSVKYYRMDNEFDSNITEGYGKFITKCSIYNQQQLYHTNNLNL